MTRQGELGAAVDAALQPGIVRVEQDGTHAEVDVVDVDRLGATIRGVSVRVPEPVGLSRQVERLSDGLRALALALTITSAAAMLDLDAVVIDGSMHRKVVDEVIARTEQVLERYSWEGISRPRLLVGSVGADARAMGGAILPLYRHFAPLHDLFLKAAPEDARSDH